MDEVTRDRFELTLSERQLAQWLVDEVRAGRLFDDFVVIWLPAGGTIAGFYGDHPDISMGSLDALTRAGLLHSVSDTRPSVSRDGTNYEISRRCTLALPIYEAVDTDFRSPEDAPHDPGQVPPESEPRDVITSVAAPASIHMDDEIEARCLPLLEMAEADSGMCDIAMRRALVILENRMRDAAGLAKGDLEGRALADVVFGEEGTLARRILDDTRRQAYRDLYAGVIGVIETTYMPRAAGPSLEQAWAIIASVNLLLTLLENPT